ncbi:MAG: hypothetical protein AAF998_24590 [Bacteroidota bacterium]
MEELIEKYSSEYYSIFGKGEYEEDINRQSVRLFVERFSLSNSEYQSRVKAQLGLMFKNRSTTVPELSFQNSFEEMPGVGGILMEKIEYEALQLIAKRNGDESIFVIENDFDRSKSLPNIRLKIPYRTSWEELQTGGTISSSLFKMPANEYFVFGNSGTWGKYVASDYHFPIYLWGFTPDQAVIFRSYFAPDMEEQMELRQSASEVFRASK